ncbi:hypothetical protein PV704_28900, partial [Streptomyces scabiei]|nr:hypothetical protein [Streptomyces scabiei]
MSKSPLTAVRPPRASAHEVTAGWGASTGGTAVTVDFDMFYIDVDRAPKLSLIKIRHTKKT